MHLIIYDDWITKQASGQLRFCSKYHLVYFRRHSGVKLYPWWIIFDFYTRLLEVPARVNTDYPHQYWQVHIVLSHLKAFMSSFSELDCMCGSYRLRYIMCTRLMDELMWSRYSGDFQSLLLMTIVFLFWLPRGDRLSKYVHVVRSQSVYTTAKARTWQKTRYIVVVWIIAVVRGRLFPGRFSVIVPPTSTRSLGRCSRSVAVPAYLVLPERSTSHLSALQEPVA